MKVPAVNQQAEELSTARPLRRIMPAIPRVMEKQQASDSEIPVVLSSDSIQSIKPLDSFENPQSDIIRDWASAVEEEQDTLARRATGSVTTTSEATSSTKSFSFPYKA